MVYSAKYLLISIFFAILLLLSSDCDKSPSNGLENDGPVYKDPSKNPEERARDLIARMALDEKIGQMTQIDRQFLQDEQDIKKYFLGSILSGGGFLISDWAAIDQLPGDYQNDIETSINAGLDMIMVPGKYIEFIENLKNLVTEKKVPLSRIDDAVFRNFKN